MSTLRYAELFAGAGGLSMGLERAGWSCAWHAEINDAARAVLSHRWPEVPLYGDVTTLEGLELIAAHGEIDLLSGGSPCQDLSVAGKRAGLGGARSSLFFEQMRLWDETGADLCLWENVDGARSSNNGRDFAEVLQAFVGADVAVPAGGWSSGGVAAGPTGVAAWRVLDAQFFGVPQRRRRVFVLGTRTGRVDPAEVLSLAEGVCGDSSSSGEAREGTPADAEASPPITFVLGSDPISRVGGAAQPVTGRNGDPGCVVAFDERNITSPGNRSNPRLGDPHHTLHDPADSILCFTGDVTHALTHEGHDASEDGTGRGTPIIVEPLLIHADCGHAFLGELDTPCPTCGKISAGAVTYPPSRGGDAASGEAIVAFARMVAFGEYVEDGTASAIKARDYKDATDLVVGTLNTRTSRSVGAQDAAAGHIIAAALRHKTHPTSAAGEEEVMLSAGIPRRLTPLECERLMSWPDRHTLVPDARGKSLSDAARYKLCGNGVASVHTNWIGWRLAMALRGELG